jgi:hypothetical protein
VTRTDTRNTWTVDVDDVGPAPGGPALVRLPDEPGEVVCRRLLARDEAMIEMGVAERKQGDHTVYLVAVEHCTHLSPAEARAAAGHLLRAADEAETRDR